HGPTRAGRGSSLANQCWPRPLSSRPVYTVLCYFRDLSAAAAPYHSADATRVGSLADGIHQGAQARRLLLLRGGGRRPRRRSGPPGARPQRTVAGAAEPLSV